MSVLGRILIVIFAYCLACIAASIVLTIGTLTPAWDDLAATGLQSGTMWIVILITASIIGAIAMLPAILVIALAEGFAVRSIVAYGLLGGVLALSLSYGLDLTGYIDNPDQFVAREREVLAAAGIVSGFVYWLVAGRRAGSWT